MEIGHNVMHGQYDWMGDPGLNSRMYDWDTVCPGEQWKYSHNYIHHTYTNILGKDRDIGYGILRMDEDQPWRPYYLGNPLYAFLLMTFFEWGVALHDLEVENIVAGKRKLEDNKPLYPGLIRKIRNQTLKDYLLFPALTGPLFPLTLAGNATANLVRNIWAFNIIFCGHFPAGVSTFSQEECEDETRGHWYYRQLLGSANITGGRLFHLMSGNLSHQIEHHLFPDLPARRYPELAVEVREICERYGLRLQHRTAVQAAVQRGVEDLPDGAAGPEAEADRPGACDRRRVGCLTESGQTVAMTTEPTTRGTATSSRAPRSARTPSSRPWRRPPTRSARWPRSSRLRSATSPPPSATWRPRCSRSARPPARRRRTAPTYRSRRSRTSSTSRSTTRRARQHAPVAGSPLQLGGHREDSAFEAFAAQSTAVASSVNPPAADPPRPARRTSTEVRPADPTCRPRLTRCG